MDGEFEVNEEKGKKRDMNGRERRKKRTRKHWGPTGESTIPKRSEIPDDVCMDDLTPKQSILRVRVLRHGAEH